MFFLVVDGEFYEIKLNDFAELKLKISAKRSEDDIKIFTVQKGVKRSAWAVDLQNPAFGSASWYCVLFVGADFRF